MSRPTSTIMLADLTQPSVYILWPDDRSAGPLYIGFSETPFARLTQHVTARTGRGAGATHFELITCTSSKDGRALEAELIRQHRPPRNVVNNPDNYVANQRGASRNRRETNFAISGSRLKALRRQKFSSAKAAAEAAGVSQPTWSGWERNARNPSPKNVVAIAAALEVDDVRRFVTEWPEIAPVSYLRDAA